MLGRPVALIAAGLLGLFLLLAVTSARQHSEVQHEPLYIYVGFQMLRYGDFQMGPEHPPGLNLLAALPLLPLGLDAHAEHGGRIRRVHEIMWQFLHRNRRPAHDILMAARVPFLVLGVVLGVFVFRWARELYGDGGGLLALGLYVASPLMLAHTQFANHDFGLACFSFLALYALWRACERTTAGRVLGAGLLLGAALLSKFTALALLPVSLVVALWHELVRAGAPRPRRLLGRAAMVAAVWMMAALAVWAGYGFAFGPLVLPTRLAMTTPGAGTSYPWSVPAPLFLWGLMAQTLHGAGGHLNFLDGEFSSGGWWRYYLMALLYKMPVPVLVLFAVRAATAPWRRVGPRGAGPFLLVLPLLLLVTFSAARTQLGERYILPIFPLVFVWLGGVARLGVPRPALAVLLAWLALGTLRVHPHYLMYFNEIAGGPRRGWQRMIESHDLGQDLDNLARWVAARQLPAIHVLCKGCESLPYRDFPHVPLALGCALPPGPVAISVYYRVLQEHLCAGKLPPGEPVDRIGYSILVYDVPADATPSAGAVSRAPAAPGTAAPSAPSPGGAAPAPPGARAGGS